MSDPKVLNKARERFTITVESMPSSIPAIARLRRLLKFALRSCGLRCVQISQNTERTDDAEQTDVKLEKNEKVLPLGKLGEVDRN